MIPSFERKRCYLRDVLLCLLETLPFSTEQASLNPLIELKTSVLRDFSERSNEFAQGGKALATLIGFHLSNLNEEGSFLCLLQSPSISESSRLLQEVHSRN